MSSIAATGGWRLGRTCESSGGRVAYEVVGDGPPVVLVHGAPSWSYLWRDVVRRLSERWKVYVDDLRDHYFGEDPN